MNNKLFQILSYLTAILIPVFLMGLSVRILLSPLFYNIEYRMPYFPSDQYGFSTEERLHWAPYSIEYLLNDADISYLSDLSFEDGRKLYNERELSHMQDVKVVTKGALWAWYLSIIILVGLAIWARTGGWWHYYRLGLRRGGWLMVGLVILIGLFGAIAFWQLFTLFHALFFEGDSWLFLYSDTLIRQFPMQFWQDAFLWAGVVSVGGGLLLGILIKPQNQR